MLIIIGDKTLDKGRCWYNIKATETDAVIFLKFIFILAYEYKFEPAEYLIIFTGLVPLHVLWHINYRIDGSLMVLLIFSDVWFVFLFFFNAVLKEVWMQTFCESVVSVSVVAGCEGLNCLRWTLWWAARSFESAFSAANQRRGVCSASSQ